MKNQATASSLASRAVQRRGEARGQRERVQTYDEVDTLNIHLVTLRGILS